MAVSYYKWEPKWERRLSHQDGPCAGGCGRCDPDIAADHDDMPDYWEPPSRFDGML